MEGIKKIKEIIRSEKFKELVRYGIVGLSVAIIEYVLAIILNYTAGAYYLFATALSSIIVFCGQFFLHKFFSFKKRSSEYIKREMILFTSFWIFAFILKIIVVKILVDTIGIPYKHSQYIAILIAAICSFFFNKIVVFGENKKNDSVLIITQKIDKDDDVLGFFYNWLKEFEKKYEKVTVICLYKGRVEGDIKSNVLSLGKEDGKSKIKYLYRFFYYIISERKNYDSVFIHMNQIYVILGWLIWTILGKKIFLWYAHGSTSLSLRLAHTMSNGIFTSTKEGFRLKSLKLHIVGQGVVVENNANPILLDQNKLNIVSIGRISPVKNFEVIINAVPELIQGGLDTNVFIAGKASDRKGEEYLETLKIETERLSLEKNMNFLGGVKYRDINTVLNRGNIFVNSSITGSLDKAGLEAIAFGLPLFTCNIAFRDLFGEYADIFMFDHSSGKDLASKIQNWILIEDKRKVEIMREIIDRVRKNHSLEGLITRIKKTM